MTEKVVVLSHVKMSSIPPGASSVRRIPWLGGTIKSNKEEALRKFYERKLTTGALLNDHQVQALQKTPSESSHEPEETARNAPTARQSAGEREQDDRDRRARAGAKGDVDAAQQSADDAPSAARGEVRSRRFQQQEQ